jgi:hypothetical protein
MKNALFVILLLPILAWAQSPFDGTWKINVDSTRISEKPDTMLLQNGIYQCPTCDPKVNIKADGTDRPVPGSTGFDTIAVKVIDNKTVEITTKKSGRVVQSEKIIVSADGERSTNEANVYPGSSKEPLAFKIAYMRVAAGPSESHAISGTWRMQKVGAPEKELIITYKSTPNGLMMSSAFAEAFDAKFDGKDYPVSGLNAGQTVSLKKVTERSFDETRKRDGKILQVIHTTVSTNGKTLTVRSESKITGATATYTATKQ